jgi:hypothetical protein
MVYMVQPKLDWDNGQAVPYPLTALEFHLDDVLRLYLDDDITDEHAVGG